MGCIQGSAKNATKNAPIDAKENVDEVPDLRTPLAIKAGKAVDESIGLSTTTSHSIEGGLSVNSLDAAQLTLLKLNQRGGSSDPRRLAMGRFIMLMGEEDVMGEGSFSICRKGIDTETGEIVAIKCFKEDQGDEKVKLQKFTKQIEVLRNLALPLVKPADPTLWCSKLETIAAEDLSMKIVDYSRSEDTRAPGPDPNDGVLYLVTELASYSLDDYLYERKEQNRPLSRRAVQELTRAVLLVVAGLHAKGLCHLDLKPENLMLFNARMKLIDVDGCVSLGSTVALGDPSVSFSPAFCAPEWARWMTLDTEGDYIDVDPRLDVWSVGMTLAQLISLDVIFEEKYAEFDGPHARANFLMWLGALEEPEIPEEVKNFDPEFKEVLMNLLVCSKEKRPNIATLMNLPFIAKSAGEDNKVVFEEEGEIKARQSVQPATINGRPWKLDRSGRRIKMCNPVWMLDLLHHPSDIDNWTLYDMWITEEDEICYYNLQFGERLLFMDQSEIADCQVSIDEKCVRGLGVTLRPRGSREDAAAQIDVRLAFENIALGRKWAAVLSNVQPKEGKTLKAAGKKADKDAGALGGKKAKATASTEGGKTPKAPAPREASATDASSSTASPALTIQCCNQRTQVPSNARRDYEPVFRTLLWKAARAADLSLEANWYPREVWISVNFSLVYYSEKFDRDLIYCSSKYLERATVEPVQNPKDYAFPWVFQVNFPVHNDVVKAPAIFAAVSENARDRWIQEFQVQQVWRSGLSHLRASVLRKMYELEGGQEVFKQASAMQDTTCVKLFIRQKTGMDLDQLEEEPHRDGHEDEAKDEAKVKKKGGKQLKAVRKSAKGDKISTSRVPARNSIGGDSMVAKPTDVKPKKRDSKRKNKKEVDVAFAVGSVDVA